VSAVATLPVKAVPPGSRAVYHFDMGDVVVPLDIGGL
jgi:hypothetical protein